MSDVLGVADRIEIEVLRADFTDAGMMGDYDRFAALFTEDGIWRMPGVPVEFLGRDNIRTGIERSQNLWEYFVQTAHPGSILLDGDTATGRGWVCEFGRMHDGSSHLNYGVYHDRYLHTPNGWRFTEREYEVRYVDTQPLVGSVPPSTFRAAR